MAEGKNNLSSSFIDKWNSGTLKVDRFNKISFKAIRFPIGPSIFNL